MSREHVKMSEGGMPYCLHCGGMVEEDGLASNLADDTEPADVEEAGREGVKSREGEIGTEPEQSVRIREFVEAMKRRKGA